MDWFSNTDWKGPAFELFGPAHLTVIFCFVALNLLLIGFRKRISPRADKIIRYSMAATLVTVETTWHIWNIYHGLWNIRDLLPLHLCSVFVWVGAYMLVTNNYTIFEFMFLLGIPAALQAFLTPDAGKFGFPHFRFFQVLMSHGFIITSALYMRFVKGYRPTWNSVKKVLIVANIYGIIVFIINMILGSNYMFSAHKIETASIMDAMPAWPYYLIFFELLGVICVLLLYSPFAISNWKAKKRQNTEAE